MPTLQTTAVLVANFGSRRCSCEGSRSVQTWRSLLGQPALFAYCGTSSDALTRYTQETREAKLDDRCIPAALCTHAWRERTGAERREPRPNDSATGTSNIPCNQVTCARPRTVGTEGISNSRQRRIETRREPLGTHQVNGFEDYDTQVCRSPFLEHWSKRDGPPEDHSVRG